LKFKKDDHLVKVGRQEMPNYKFVSLSNIRMTPFTHEGAIYENSSIEGLKINLAYIKAQKDRNDIVFQDMVRSARVKTGCGAVNASGECTDSGSKMTIRGEYDPGNYNSSGNYDGDDKTMPMLGLSYRQNNWAAEAWNYYVDDFVNTLYLYGQYNIKLSNDWKVALAGQYANQQDVGGSVAGNVDTWFYGLKAEASTNTWQLPTPVSITGTELFSTTVRIRPAPPRGISRSRYLFIRIIARALSRLVSSTTCTAPAGNPQEIRAFCNISRMVWLE